MWYRTESMTRLQIWNFAILLIYVTVCFKQTSEVMVWHSRIWYIKNNSLTGKGVLLFILLHRFFFFLHPSHYCLVQRSRWVGLQRLCSNLLLLTDLLVWSPPSSFPLQAVLHAEPDTLWWHLIWHLLKAFLIGWNRLNVTSQSDQSSAAMPPQTGPWWTCELSFVHVTACKPNGQRRRSLLRKLSCKKATFFWPGKLQKLSIMKNWSVWLCWPHNTAAQ